MDQTKALAYAKKYFQAWPKVDQFFITSDGLAFFNAQDAAAHATGTRKDKIVVQVQRSQLTAPPAEAAPASAAVSGAETATTPAAGSAAPAAASGSAPAK